MRRLIIITIAFAAGFFTNSFLTTHGYMQAQTPQIVVSKLSGADKPPETDVTISYKNGSFHPAVTSIALGRHLIIVNDSDSLMWLTSDNDLLNTPRGYGLKEQINVRMRQPGTYTVSNKLHLGATVTITVVKN